jgi:hypothetical protein
MGFGSLDELCAFLRRQTGTAREPDESRESSEPRDISESR